MIAPRADSDLSLLLTERPSAVDYAAGPVQPPAPPSLVAWGFRDGKEPNLGRKHPDRNPGGSRPVGPGRPTVERPQDPGAASRADPKSIQDFKDLIMRQS